MVLPWCKGRGSIIFLCVQRRGTPDVDEYLVSLPYFSTGAIPVRNILEVCNRK
jgi:hypothetical protein